MLIAWLSDKVLAAVRTEGCTGSKSCMSIESATRQGARQLEAGTSFHVGKANPQQNLRLFRRDCHAQEIDGLAKRGSDCQNSLSGDHVFDRAAHEGNVVREADVDVRTRKFTCDLFPNGIQPKLAGSHQKVINQANVALLPDHQRGLPRGQAVDQDLFRADDDCLGQRGVGYGHALDGRRAINAERFAYRHHQPGWDGLRADGWRTEDADDGEQLEDSVPLHV